MTPGFQKAEPDVTAATGASEADAAKPVQFEENANAGPQASDGEDQPPDAAELAGTKRKDGDQSEGGEAEPGAVATRDLTTETDDGAG